MRLNEVTGISSKRQYSFDCVVNCTGLDSGTSASTNDALAQLHCVALAPGVLATALASVIARLLINEERRAQGAEGKWRG